MRNGILGALLKALAFAAIATWGPVAQATIFGDDFDPPIPPWSGHATFFVPGTPSPCLSLGSGLHSVNQESDPCQGVALVGLSADFGTTHFSFTGSSTNIFDMILGSGPVLLQGIDSNPIPIGCSGPICDDSSWFVQFTAPFDSVTLFEQLCDGNCFLSTVAIAPNQTFSNPEPGSLALILGALGVGWLSKRRKTT